MDISSTHQRYSHRARGGRPLAALIAFEALTLAVFAALHLSGALHVGSKSGTSYGAGIAEATICLALAIGATALLRAPATGHRAALVAVAYAIFGFIVGLTFTIRGADAIDIAYHSIMLPALLATALLLRRARHHPDSRT
jgi:hypothetical protein